MLGRLLAVRAVEARPPLGDGGLLAFLDFADVVFQGVETDQHVTVAGLRVELEEANRQSAVLLSKPPDGHDARHVQLFFAGVPIDVHPMPFSSGIAQF
jgi:hypothetical protein